MGTSKSVPEFVAKFERLALNAGQANYDAVEAAARTYKDVMLIEVAKDTGGNMKLSAWGSPARRKTGGLKLGVGYDIKGRENATAFIYGRPQGAWKVLEYGTQPHIIGLGKGATSRLISYALGGGPNKRARGQLNRQLRKQKALFANTGPGSKSARGGGYSHPIARPIQHPGTSGKRTFTRGARRAEPRAIEVYNLAYLRSVSQVIR